jgi:predicted TIM-barrel fold metal-dependent hydrolase
VSFTQVATLKRQFGRWMAAVSLAAVAVATSQAVAFSQSAAEKPSAKLPPSLADYHLHIQSQALSDALRHFAEHDPQIFAGLDRSLFRARTGTDALRLLDAAGIKYGVLLSEAYMFTSPIFHFQNMDTARMTREENAYNVAAAANSGGRLVAFISVNPMSSGAIREIDHWHRTGGASGIKLHLANSQFDFKSAKDIAALKQVFSEAKKCSFPIIIHLRNAQDYGAAQVDTFVNEVLPSAGGIPVQIAHGAGWGGLDEQTISALAAFSKAIAAHRPGTASLTFDLALVVFDEHTDPRLAQRFVAQMRAIGIERFAMGSDWPGKYTPGDYVRLAERVLPLKDAEWRVILAHRAGYIGR